MSKLRRIPSSDQHLDDERWMWEGEQTILCSDDAVGLRAVIAINSTVRGPALGGVRFALYPSDMAAVREARGLAAAMTAKNALAELPYGGAKAVILSRGPVPDRAALMRAFRRFVARTDGWYIPGVDMGTTLDDLAIIGEGGIPVSCSKIDPSGWTASGVFAAVQAAVAADDAIGGLDGATILIQGAGRVGGELARRLHAVGANIVVADIDAPRAERLARELDGIAIHPDAVINTPCDVFCPCATARVLTADTIPRLRCRIVAGAANDTLGDESCDALLAQHGVLYVPDFIANAGGVIQIHADVQGLDAEATMAAVMQIGDRVTELLSEAQASSATPLQAAYARLRQLLAGARSEPLVSRRAG